MLDEMTRQEQRRTSFEGEGLLVESVERGSPFQNFNVVGTIVVEVDRTPVPDFDSYNEIVERLKKGEAVLVTFYNPRSPENDRYQSLAIRVP
jgi:S1-C subfamily serine protease